MIRSALGRLWEEDGQDVAEYAVMLAVILAVVVGTIRMIGSDANNVFSSVAARSSRSGRQVRRTPEPVEHSSARTPLCPC